MGNQSLVSAWLPLVLYVLCWEVLDLEERAELNLILLHQLYVDKRKRKRCFELSISLSHILVIHYCKLALEELLFDSFDNHLSNTANLGWKHFCLWQLSETQNEAKCTLLKTLLGECTLLKTLFGERCEMPLLCSVRETIPAPPSTCIIFPSFSLIVAYCLLPLAWIQLPVTILEI